MLGIDAPEFNSEISFEACHTEQGKEYLESKLPIGTPVRLRAGGDRIDDQNKMLTATLRTGKQTSVDELATAQERWIPDSITG